MLNNENRCFDNLQICIWSNYPAPSITGMSSILTVIGKITFATQPLPQRRVSWNTKFKFNTIFFLFVWLYFFVFSTTRQWKPLTWRITATAWAAHLQHEQSESNHLRTKPAKKLRVTIRMASVCTLLQEISDIKRMTAENKRNISTFCTHRMLRIRLFKKKKKNPSIPDMTKKHKHL